jgi:hypothetical protein
VIDRILEHIDETLIHKQYILQSARILSRYLIENGNLDAALELVKRCSVHDDSKFSPEEIYAFIKLSNKESLKNAKATLDEATKEALKLHWENNGHHPEHFEDYSMMTDLDLMEMACDCNARSMQYDTNLLDFIEIRQEQRFHFPTDMYEKYKSYCVILANGSKEIEDMPKMLIKKKDE